MPWMGRPCLSLKLVLLFYLRCNSNAIKFPPLTYTIQYFFVFTVLTELYNRHHYLIPEYLHHAPKKPQTYWQSLSIISLAPASGNLESSSCLYGFTYSDISNQLCNVWLRMSGFFRLACGFQGSSTSQHGPVSHPFLRPSNTPPRERSAFLFTRSPADGRLAAPALWLNE